MPVVWGRLAICALTVGSVRVEDDVAGDDGVVEHDLDDGFLSQQRCGLVQYLGRRGGLGDAGDSDDVTADVGDAAADGGRLFGL